MNARSMSSAILAPISGCALMLAVVLPAFAQARFIDYDKVAAAVRAAPGAKSGVKLCWFAANIVDKDKSGTNLRAGPSTLARVIKRIENRRMEAGTEIWPEMQVIGAKDGWFLVRQVHWAGYDQDEKMIHEGPAWIAASLVSATMEGISLYKSPGPKPPVIRELRGKAPDGSDWSALDLPVKRMHDCSGSMVEVTFTLPNKSEVRGWANGACANQVTTCGGGHMLVHEKGGRLVPQEED